MLHTFAIIRPTLAMAVKIICKCCNAGNSFYVRVTFLKNVVQIKYKIPIKTLYFLGVRGLTTHPI
jgi:hypothetical protein